MDMENCTFKTRGKTEGSEITWTPDLRGNVMKRIVHLLNWEIGEFSIENLKKVKAEKLFDVLWFTVSSQASGAGISQDDFLDLVTFPQMCGAARAIFSSVVNEMKDMRKAISMIREEMRESDSGDKEGEESPLDPGAGKTS